ncbi:hypothetical protein B0H21DRAFT_776483 [Amylocystis lapponica]|nr:hypothetical protein B0H21DRAFT_776483 [Amylocystis lapponica]
MTETMTQRFVAQYLRANNKHDVRAPRVYLAFTEFIDGWVCDNSDTALVAAAVQALIAIPSPNSRHGPVGGGLIEHPFFVDRTSSIQYESVEELEDHVNGILSVTGKKGCVRLRDEVINYGLCLCVSDLKLVNFMRDKDGRIVAVDYGGYYFLLPSFALALRYRAFAHELSAILQYPPASCALAPFSSNNLGEHISLLSLLLFLSFFFAFAPLQEHRADYTAQAFRNVSSPGFMTERGAQAFARPVTLPCAVASTVARFAMTQHG